MIMIYFFFFFIQLLALDRALMSQYICIFETDEFLTVIVSLAKSKDDEKKGKRNAALPENPRCLGTFNGLTTDSKNLSLS
jgi:hypothetical protein